MPKRKSLRNDLQPFSSMAANPREFRRMSTELLKKLTDDFISTQEECIKAKCELNRINKELFVAELRYRSLRDFKIEAENIVKHGDKLLKHFTLSGPHENLPDELSVYSEKLKIWHAALENEPCFREMNATKVKLELIQKQVADEKERLKKLEIKSELYKRLGTFPNLHNAKQDLIELIIEKLYNTIISEKSEAQTNSQPKTEENKENLGN